MARCIFWEVTGIGAGWCGRGATGKPWACEQVTVQGAVQGMGIGIKLASFLHLSFTSCIILNDLPNSSKSQFPHLWKKKDSKALVNEIIYRVLSYLYIRFFKCYSYFNDCDGEIMNYYKQWYSRWFRKTSLAALCSMSPRNVKPIASS